MLTDTKAKLSCALGVAFPSNVIKRQKEGKRNKLFWAAWCQMCLQIVTWYQMCLSIFLFFNSLSGSNKLQYIQHIRRWEEQIISWCDSREPLFLWTEFSTYPAVRASLHEVGSRSHIHTLCVFALAVQIASSSWAFPHLACRVEK